MQYAATIWVDGPTREAIHAIRRELDCRTGLTAPHMTVVFPHPVDMDAEEIRTRTCGAVVGQPPFFVTPKRSADYGELLRLDPVGTDFLRATYPPFRNPIVILPSEGADRVLDLRHRLHSVFGQPPELENHPPFVLITQGLDDNAAGNAAAGAAASLARLRTELKFEVSFLDILEFDDDGGWNFPWHRTAGSVTARFSPD